MDISDRLRRIVLATPWVALLTFIQAVPVVSAKDSQQNEVQPTIDFVVDVRPILKERCFACHGALKQEASLRVDSAAHLLRGGDSGEVVDRKSIEDSELLYRLTDEDESTRMPPEGKPLTREEIETIREWIKQGAKVPDNDVAESSPRDHWAFQKPVKKIDLATAKVQVGANASTNPIDILLESSRQAAGLTATQKVASKSLLLRRLYIDLIGVPPNLDEIKAFEKDSSPEAYEKVVKELLSRPQYGERWARHWMDVWRYTDWYGLGAQLRNSQKHIWHWRDWIIDSLNEDQGYDQMIREMLAADEIYPADRSKLRATGFLARNYYLFNRTTWLDSTIEHTGKAFLGLTLNCAKCHDHKYDPISQSDYYRLRAIFEPHQVRLDPVPGTTDLEKDGLPRVFDAHPELPTYVHIRGNEKEPDKSQTMTAGVPGFFDFRDYQPTEIALPPEAYRPELQEFVLADRMKKLETEIRAAEQSLKASAQKLEELAAATPKDSDKLVGYRELDLKQVSSDQFQLNDSFENIDAKTWRIVNGKWQVIDGQLVQQETGPVARIVESLNNHPQDFLLEAKLKVTGGQMWKSFGIRFDATQEHEKTVYLSAFSDSKVQVSYANNGNTTYPTNGLAKLPVKEDQYYTLRIAIRGKRINVSVDGKHQVAFEFPIERKVGKIQLMSFDSVASFDQVQMVELPNSVRLQGAGKSIPLTVEEAERQVRLASQKLKTAKLKRDAIRAGHLADRASEIGNPKVDDLVRQAVLARIRFEEADKQVALIDIENKLKTANGKEKQQLEKSLADTRKQLAALTKESAKPGTRYESIRASRKALEGPDEKPESRNQPFPKISTGRRTAFADWIVDRQNPLTARVAVNQVWMRHFGRPLVDPVIDFGRRAKPPLQQKLLDWLAADFHGARLEDETTASHDCDLSCLPDGRRR